MSVCIQGSALIPVMCVIKHSGTQVVWRYIDIYIHFCALAKYMWLIDARAFRIILTYISWPSVCKNKWKFEFNNENSSEFPVTCDIWATFCFWLLCVVTQCILTSTNGSLSEKHGSWKQERRLPRILRYDLTNHETKIWTSNVIDETGQSWRRLGIQDIR